MKTKLQRLLRPVLMAIGAVAVIAGLGFAEHRADRSPVKAIAVSVDAPEGVHFIDENTVREELLHDGGAVIGAAVADVDARAIEEKLRGIGCVANAEVYHTLDGTLHVRVKQREPIVRVINMDGSGFYIDREGWTMPLSDTYAARVLVVTGQLSEPFATGAPVNVLANDSPRRIIHSDEVWAVARTITADPFWNALFDQAVVDADGNMELVPRVGGQRVRIGDGTDLAGRLAKLRAFYAKGIPQSDWHAYSAIDLRFADQVVCTRKQNP